MTFRKLLALGVVIEALPFILFYGLLVGAAMEIANASDRVIGATLRRS